MTVDLSSYRFRVGLFLSYQQRTKGLKCLNQFELLTWLSILLILAGDVHENPGPLLSTSSTDTSSSSEISLDSQLSILHYNVQSFFSKKDVLYAELNSFDICCFTESWLHDGISSEDIIFQNYSLPFRRDRPTDNHGGVLVYVRDNITAFRRRDLEPNDLEVVWVELVINQKRILLGTFYRPPNSSPLVLSAIETSIGLAIDTGITDIIVTGDFNIDYLKPQS